MFSEGPGERQAKEIHTENKHSWKLLLLWGSREKDPKEYSRRCLSRWFYLGPESKRIIKFKQFYSLCFYFGSAGVCTSVNKSTGSGSWGCWKRIFWHIADPAQRTSLQDSQCVPLCVCVGGGEVVTAYKNSLPRSAEGTEQR